MAPLRDWPISEVVRQLELALPAADGSRTVASSAITQARARLGADPIEWLFLRSSETWANASADRDRWRDRPACDQARGLAADSIADLSSCTLVETAVCFAGGCYPSTDVCAGHRGPDSVGNCTEQR